MNNIFKFLFLLLAICTTYAHAQDCDHSRGTIDNYFIPNVSFTFVPYEITQNSAVAMLAEGGRRNFRINGTYGFLFKETHKLKASFEYLQQKLGYKFTPGKANRWVRQYATGVTYALDFCHPYIVCGEVSAYYSYAPSHILRGPIPCDTLRSTRRIAGSNAFGGELSATVKLGCYGHLFLDAIYDSVAYQRKYRSKKYVNGFGGSIAFSKYVNNFGLDLKAEFRRPYNFYRGDLKWFPQKSPGLSLGLYASCVRGKINLPNNTTVGVEVVYAILNQFKPKYDCENNPCHIICCGNQELACWVSRPAVYMPEVLAIAEERVCQVPITVGIIPDFGFTTVGVPFSIPTAQYFSSPDPLTFSATGLPPGASIDPVTGVISGTTIVSAERYNVVVTATSSCGSASQSFMISFCVGVPTSTPITNFATCLNGPYSYDVSGFFTNSPNSPPLMFSATGLPPGATIGTLDGIITGTNLDDTNTYSVTVSATNGCGSTSQTFSMIFTCPIPTSTPIANINIGVLSGDPYSFSVAASFATSCGRGLSFSATGLPGGSSINPTTGVISGIVPVVSGPFNVTVTAANSCGTTQQSFQLTFESQ